MSRNNLKTYGENVTSEEISSFLDYTLKQNDLLAKKGKRGTPICIWGTHGIGKTELVLEFAKKNNFTVVYCAPAQFEEMGDLHGIPEAYDPSPETPNSGDEYTVYRPPEWLRAAIDQIDSNTPGLLILDDFNRAESRILQGCMQLLQMHALFSWSLPPRWQIVLTANPEGGPYKVTEMDDAMLTRMMHVTMKFDAKCWAQWATDKKIDPRGIDFLLTYPSVVTGIRTTARSFTQFIEQVSSIQDLEKPENIRLVQLIGKGTLESETVDRFLHFCKFVKSSLIQPEEILGATDFNKDIANKIKKIVSGEGYQRTDLLNTICTRLGLFLLSTNYKPEPAHKDNLVEFLLCKEMTGQLRFKLHHMIANSNKTEIRKLIQDPRLANQVLNNL